MTLFPEDITEMTPAEREKAIDAMIADGYSRAAAEQMIAFETGETDGDLIEGPAKPRKTSAAA